jgi:hypothetical protein
MYVSIFSKLIVSSFEYLTVGFVSMSIAFYKKAAPTLTVRKFPVFYEILWVCYQINKGPSNMDSRICSIQS